MFSSIQSRLVYIHKAEDKRSHVIKFWGHVIVLSCGAVDPGQAFDLIFEFKVVRISSWMTCDWRPQAMRIQTWRAGWYRTMASDATSHSRANDFCPLHMTVCKCAHDVLAHAGSADQHECLPALFLLALSGTCRRRSVPDMPSIMRCLRHTLVTRTSGPACMHCMPTRCPSAVHAALA